MTIKLIFPLQAISNQLSAPLGLPGLLLGSSPTHPSIDRTVSLEPEADWQKAVEKNLARQNLYNNVIKEVFNSLTRIIGWTLISLVCISVHK